MPTDFYHWLVLASLKACIILPLALLAVFVSRRTASAVIHVLLACALLWVPLSPFLGSGFTITIPLLETLDAFPEDLPELAAYDRKNPIVSLPSEIKYTEKESIHTSTVLLTLWGLGALTFLAVRLWKSMNSKLRMARSQPVARDNPLHQELEALCHTLGLKAVPWLLCNSLIRGVQTTGLFNHSILIPTHFGQYQAEQRHMILIHELAHIRRRDTLWRTLLEGVAIVFWFHPLVWLVLRRYDEQTEKACDDAVLQANYPPAQYAEALLAATKPPQLSSVSTQASAPVGLRGRMFSVLNKEKNRLPLTWNATAKFMVFFSIIIIPIALISFTPYPTDQGYEIVKDPEDLSALWRMKLGRGSILPDSSGGENHGKIHGAKWVLDPQRGHCLSLDGVNDHLVLRAPEMSWTSKPFSLCVWLKPSSNSDGGGLLLRGDKNLTWCSALGSSPGAGKSFGEREFLLAGPITSSRQYSTRSRGLMFLLNSWGVAVSQCEKSLKPGQWNHVAFTWRPAGSSALIQIYLNGKPAGVRHIQQINRNSYADWPAEVWYFGLGESPISAGNNYEGLVSDLAVYQKYLSAKEVIKVMRGNFSITK